MQRIKRGKHFKAIREKVLNSMDIWNGPACDCYAFRYTKDKKFWYGEYCFESVYFEQDAIALPFTHIFSLVSKEFFVI